MPTADEPERTPLVMAVVPVRNRRELTLRFLRALAASAHPRLEAVVVDDGSSDGTAAAIARDFPRVAVLRGSGDLWWAGATNAGVRHALAHGADYILTINDDAVFGPDLVPRLVRVAQADPWRMVGARIHDQDHRERVWAIGFSAPFAGNRVWVANHAGRAWPDIAGTVAAVEPVEVLCGNGVLIPRAAYLAAGLYDRRNLPQYHADSDFILRARACGFSAVVATDAVLYNHESGGDIPRRRWQVVASRKSPLYWPALTTILWRHGPARGRLALLAGQYAPHLLPAAWVGRLRAWAGPR
jgi:GT2 family glycosyltransferase